MHDELVRRIRCETETELDYQHYLTQKKKLSPRIARHFLLSSDKKKKKATGWVKLLLLRTQLEMAGLSMERGPLPRPLASRKCDTDKRLRASKRAEAYRPCEKKKRKNAVLVPMDIAVALALLVGCR
jgi:hypothetical protein